MICCADARLVVTEGTSTSRREGGVLTVDIQPGRAGHDPGLVLGRHRVPARVILGGPLDEQAHVAVVVLVQAAKDGRGHRARNVSGREASLFISS